MKNARIASELQKLEALFRATAASSGGDLELQSHWAKYLCVRVAGCLENAVFEIYSDVISRMASPRVAKFATSRLEKVQNPKADKFLEIARAFDSKWADELEAFLAGEGRKEAVDSIMANRHLIAHGDNSGITIARLRGFFDKSVEVLEYIEIQCC
jgi:hypothetical protein